MNPVEIIRAALAELGDVSADAMAAFAQARFGVKLNPKIVPIAKATLLDRERLAAARAARTVAMRTAEVAGEAGSAAPAPLDAVPTVQA